MPKGAQRKTSKLRAAAIKRRADALELRVAGATYEQMAAKLGVTRESCRQAVIAAVADLEAVCAERATEVRELELRRLDAMLLGLWDRARRGEVRAVDAVLRIQDRRAKLLGLDAAMRIDAKVTPDDGTKERLARLLDSVAERIGAGRLAIES